jgi:hypothetical protein
VTGADGSDAYRRPMLTVDVVVLASVAASPRVLLELVFDHAVIVADALAAV